MSESRPDPDVLLAHVQREDRVRGKLKIFFGMCPGVGKTYTMLEAARQRAMEGEDVVAGYVEPHARPETEAILLGLDVLPRLQVAYRGVRLEEFDLDAALRRRPRLLLVDELAHTNAPGARHAKRYQDVEELLDAGIDVYTTLNVQHLESLGDVVAQITGVAVRETVPDRVVDGADDVELVDLPPDDLLERLKEGRVYIPEQAGNAIQGFFRRENLVALRELALRAIADRVNAQVQAQHAGRREPWATSERLLVCVGPSPLSARVLRTARRMAAAQHGRWFAVAVETPGMSRAAGAQLRENLRLAERLGAETVLITADRPADEILAYATRHNITRIVIGKPALPRWREWLTGSFVNEIVRRSGEIDVHIVKGEGSRETMPDPALTQPQRTPLRAYSRVVGVMLICTALAWLACPYLSPVNLTMIYLAGVVFVATRQPAGPSAFACVLAALLFDVLFTQPYYSFAIADTQYLITFFVLLTTALIISGLTQRVRRQTERARVRYLRTIALYFMTRLLAAAPDRQAVLSVAARHIKDVFGAESVLLTPDASGALAGQASAGEWFAAGVNETSAAQWVFDHRRWAGCGTDTLPGCQGFYIPLVASGRTMGVLGVRCGDGGLEPDQRHMLETFATQVAISLERAEFAEQAEGARVAMESEQLRNALLSSVSHDLRTPLAAITGSASALLQDEGALAAETRRELLESIHDEGVRLNQFVGKLLDMTRLESGGVRLSRDWFAVEDIVGSALTRMEHALREHIVETDVPGDLPAVFVDGVLVEEVLVNLLENAVRYTPPGSMVCVRARQAPEHVRIEVADNGPGLQPGTLDDVFHKFFRDRPRTDRSGTGLGLAICRAIVRLHDGQIGVENQPRGGACFWFTLPVVGTPPTPNAAHADASTTGAAGIGLP